MPSSLVATGCGLFLAKNDAQLAKYAEPSSEHEATLKEYEELTTKGKALKAERRDLGFEQSANTEERKKLLSALEDYCAHAEALARIKIIF